MITMPWHSSAFPSGTQRRFTSWGPAHPFATLTPWAEYDCALREYIQLVLSVQLNDQSWLPSTLPPVLGEIGVRTPSDLALPAFLSSATATLPLASSICGGAPESLILPALTTWQEKAETVDPQGPAHTALAWQRPLDQAKRERLTNALSMSRDVARLHSASTPESAALFRGLPSSREGTRLTNIETYMSFSTIRCGNIWSLWSQRPRADRCSSWTHPGTDGRSWHSVTVLPSDLKRGSSRKRPPNCWSTLGRGLGATFAPRYVILLQWFNVSLFDSDTFYYLLYLYCFTLTLMLYILFSMQIAVQLNSVVNGIINFWIVDVIIDFRYLRQMSKNYTKNQQCTKRTLCWFSEFWKKNYGRWPDQKW